MPCFPNAASPRVQAVCQVQPLCQGTSWPALGRRRRTCRHRQTASRPEGRAGPAPGRDPWTRAGSAPASWPRSTRAPAKPEHPANAHSAVGEGRLALDMSCRGLHCMGTEAAAALLQHGCWARAVRLRQHEEPHLVKHAVVGLVRVAAPATVHTGRCQPRAPPPGPRRHLLRTQRRSRQQLSKTRIHLRWQPGTAGRTSSPARSPASAPRPAAAAASGWTAPARTQPTQAHAHAASAHDGDLSAVSTPLASTCTLAAGTAAQAQRVLAFCGAYDLHAKWSAQRGPAALVRTAEAGVTCAWACAAAGAARSTSRGSCVQAGQLLSLGACGASPGSGRHPRALGTDALQEVHAGPAEAAA